MGVLCLGTYCAHCSKVFHYMKNEVVSLCFGSLFLISLFGCRKAKVADVTISRQLEVSSVESATVEKETQTGASDSQWLNHEGEEQFVIVEEEAGPQKHYQISSPQNVTSPPGDYNLGGWPPGEASPSGLKLSEEMIERFKADKR